MNKPNHTADASNFWEILKRRKLSFFIPFVLFACIGIAFSLLLPPVFRSEATILIERQTIPKDIIDTTVTGYIQEQIEKIRQRIATPETLIGLSEKYGLHQEEVETDRISVIRKIAEAFEVNMREVTSTDPDRNGPRKATVSFNVSFNNENPEIAKNVTGELAELFLQEHRAAREERAKEVTSFIEVEANALKEELQIMENEIALFKQEKSDQLPEMKNLNLTLFEKTENQIGSTETRIRQLGDKLSSLRAELSLTDPYLDVVTNSGTRISSAADRLSALTAEYLQARTRYSEKHPDVISMAREIQILAEQNGGSARTDEVLKNLVRAQERLRTARLKYKDGHPEIQAIEKSVASLQKGLQSTVISAAPRVENIPPDNPRYVALVSEIRSTESNESAERENRAKLQQKLTEYEERLFGAPFVDSELRALTVDYDSARQKYRELIQKLRKAQLAEQLEAGSSAERFVLVSQAYLPTLPESPNRIAIMALSLMMALIIGLVTASLREYIDKTIHGAKSVVNSLGVPPLAIIPKIPARAQVMRLDAAIEN